MISIGTDTDAHRISSLVYEARLTGAALGAELRSPTRAMPGWLVAAAAVCRDAARPKVKIS
jgi:hypothetical protein